jgi:hypothetical protein
MIYLSALIGPFFLLLIEGFLPFPFLVEEIYKFFLVKKPIETKIVIIIGFLFSLSEAIFYVMNPFYSLITNPYSLVLRLLVVFPMHTTTLLIMNYYNKKRDLWYLGLILGVFIHFLFNNLNML